MPYRALALLETSADVFLGLSVLLGAAFLFYRSKRAALFAAVGGASMMGATSVAYVVRDQSWGRSHHVTVAMVSSILTLLFVAGHALFFGGIFLAMREVARGPTQ